MIRLTRPKSKPRSLTSRGRRETKVLKDSYEAGTREFKFKSAIYGAKDVRSALHVMHHGKCAFCESLLPQLTAGHVEHFRPKGEVQQDIKAPLQKPGYYWLAYEWGNLLLACEWCNSRAKKKLFPLVDINTRATHHKLDFRKESALLLNPATDNPEKHLQFAKEIVRPARSSARGSKSIEVYRLDDPGLTDTRKKKLDIFSALVDLSKLTTLIPEAKRAQQQIKGWLRDIENGKMEYSAMLRSNLKPLCSKMAKKSKPTHAIKKAK